MLQESETEVLSETQVLSVKLQNYWSSFFLFTVGYSGEEQDNFKVVK